MKLIKNKVSIKSRNMVKHNPVFWVPVFFLLLLTHSSFSQTISSFSCASGFTGAPGTTSSIITGKGFSTTTANNVSVLCNNSTVGSLSLATAVDIATGTTPTCIAIDDMDGDGKPELAVVNSSSFTLTLNVAKSNMQLRIIPF